MNKINNSISSISYVPGCCVTGNTKLGTVDGVKTFKELADSNDDVNVYCLDVDGNIKVSKMFHPRISGYNIKLAKITLEDGTVLTTSLNHMFLTKDGYVSAEDIFESDKIIVLNDGLFLPTEIDEKDKPFTEYTGTKKGTVIKRCEVSGKEFECDWEEREICSENGYEADLYNIKTHICTQNTNYKYLTVKSVEFPELPENVYNGTVAIYHNYFTIDENTGVKVNQFN